MTTEVQETGVGRPWTVWVDAAPLAPQEKVAREEALLGAVASGRLGAVLRLWTNGPSLVLGRSEARRLEQSGQLASRFGHVPVLVRPSGGTAVPHGPDDLSITLCYPVRQVPVAPEVGYRLLLAGLKLAFQRALGLEAGSDWVPGSFCDGRFNLVVGGRKVAGTAQAQRRGAVLVHATVMVGGEGAARLRQVAAFYRQVGLEGPWDERSVASLSELAGRTLAPGDLVEPIVDAYLTGPGPAGASGSYDESSGDP